MSGPIVCYVLTPIGRARRSLRRYRDGDSCPVSGYHTASVLIDEIDWTEPYVGRASNVDEAHPLRSDDRWPKACACGELFKPDDHWQEFDAQLYRGTHPAQGEIIVTTDEAPPGALWRAAWCEDIADWRGSDGHSWIVQCPPGPWHIDGAAVGGGRWERTGTAPKFTVRPSILFFRTGYHAYLTDGVLVPC